MKILKSMLVLIVVDAVVHLFRFSTLAHLLRHVHTTSSHSRSEERVMRTLNFACLLYPRVVRCLVYSAAATILLRREGHDVHLVVGMRKIPFAAHAWCELDGKPILDNSVARDELVPAFRM